MTEAEWLTCNDPQTMLDSLGLWQHSRKVRLMFVAHCYRAGEWLPEKCKPVVQVAERYADGQATRVELEGAEELARNLLEWHEGQMIGVEENWCLGEPVIENGVAYVEVNEQYQEESQAAHLRYAASYFALNASLRAEWLNDLSGWGFVPDERPADAHNIRCLFGNPFRPVPALNPDWLSWNGGTVPRLATAIYDEPAFGRLPVLADALEDAGCTDADILEHCRGPGPHVRGCWVVDLLLGRE